MIKTFRGLLADGGQDRIRLQTIKGKVGYRIVKLELFPNLPGTQASESTVQIWKTQQTTISATTATVDFTDSDLLAASFVGAGDPLIRSTFTTSFDAEVFNQDIYVTHTNTDGAGTCNYYLELEVIPLDDAGAEYTTLKDMRQG